MGLYTAISNLTSVLAPASPQKLCATYSVAKMPPQRALGLPYIGIDTNLHLQVRFLGQDHS